MLAPSELREGRKRRGANLANGHGLVSTFITAPPRRLSLCQFIRLDPRSLAVDEVAGDSCVALKDKLLRLEVLRTTIRHS